MFILTITIIISLISITLVKADNIILNNGSILKGNILEVYDETTPSLLLDVVINNELTNVKIKLYGSEMKTIEVNDEFRGLVKLTIGATPDCILKIDFVFVFIVLYPLVTFIS